jgi:hypothetical protein
MGVMEFILGIVVISSVASIIKAGMSYKTRRMPAADREAFKRIEETVLQMRDEISAVRQDVDELQERVDFAERVLTRGKEGELRLGN